MNRTMPNLWEICRRLLVLGAFISFLSGTSCRVPDADGAPRGFQWSDYGLVLSSDRAGGTMDLYLHTLESGEAQLIDLDPSSIYGPSWSPDGGRILFTIEANGQADVYALDSAGAGRHNLTSREGFDGSASYSPDGQTIVFVSTRDALAEGHAGRDLWLMDSDGSNARPLTRNTMYEGGPRFSPDGRRIAFCRQIPTEGGSQDGEIFVIDVEGNRETRITSEDGFDCLPDWSPNGGMLAFQGCREDGCFFFVARSDGSDLRRITNDQFGGQWPRWSPDGEWIAYTSARNDQTDIWVIRPDGSTSSQRGRSAKRSDEASPSVR